MGIGGWGGEMIRSGYIIRRLGVGFVDCFFGFRLGGGIWLYVFFCI